MMHALGTRQKAKLYRARMFTGTRVFRAYLRLVFQNIIEMSVQNSMFIGGFSLIKININILDGLNTVKQEWYILLLEWYI